MPKIKKSFFERLTGAVMMDNDSEEVEYEVTDEQQVGGGDMMDEQDEWIEEENNEGELTVDVYQTNTDIIIQTMVAGVRPEDLDIAISREMVTIKGRRTAPHGIHNKDYYFQELYWGAFSRTILLPQEIEADEAEAMEKNGLLVIRLPKIDKDKTKRLKVKAV